jgi:hypothetical protein
MYVSEMAEKRNYTAIYQYVEYGRTTERVGNSKRRKE